MRRDRGFTLIEMLMVVAIIGIISSLAASGIINTVRMAKLRGASSVASQVLNNARRFAILQHCTFIAQLNGDQFLSYSSSNIVAPAGKANHATLIRKNRCSSPNGYYEVGDIVVDEYALTSNTPGQGSLNQSFVVPAIGGAENTSPTSGISIAFLPNGEHRISTGQGTNSAPANWTNDPANNNASVEVRYKQRSADTRGYARVLLQLGATTSPEYVP